MPFKSEKQRRFLWAEHPEIAKKWADKYPESNKNLPMYANADSNEKARHSVEKRTKVSYTMNTRISDLISAYVNNRPDNLLTITNTNSSQHEKTADSRQEEVTMPANSKPVYAGEEHENNQSPVDIPEAKNISGANSTPDESEKTQPGNAINDLLTKLSVVLSPHIEQTMENMNAEAEGRVARRIQKNRGIKSYPCAAPAIPLPMGMAQNQPQQPQNQQPMRPVGGGSHPQFNPINSYGGLSLSGQLNGNAAFGAKNSPDSSKTAAIMKQATRSITLGKLTDISETDTATLNELDEEFADEMAQKHAHLDIKTCLAIWEKWAQKNTPCSCGCGDTVSTCKCSASCSCRQKGGSCYKADTEANKEKSAGKQLGLWDRIRMKKERGEKPAKKGDKDYPDAKSWKKVTSISEKEAGTPAWQRSEGKNEEGGLNAKGRASYNKATGGNLKAPVTESNPKGKRAKRQNSFCARMCGMKRVNTGSKTKSDPDSRINKSLRKWNCKCSSAHEFGEKFAALVAQLPRQS